MSPRGPIAILIAAVAGVACSDTPRTPAADTPANPDAEIVGEALPPDARVQLDSGNAAFSAGNFEVALHHYRASASLAPDLVSPWYGISMAAQRLGNAALADSAMVRVQALVPVTSLPAHPDSAPPALPPGH